MAATTLSNLIDPQVIADFVEKKLIDAIKFAPLCVNKDDLVGRAGDTLSFPAWTMCGDAESVLEGGEISIDNLTNSMVDVKVHKIAKGIGFTDEAKLSGLADGSLLEQAVKQITLAIASKVETEIIAAMQNATLTYSYNSSNDAAQNIAAALEKFGEDMDGKKVLIVPPSMYTTLVGAKGWIPNTELGANILINGTVGQIMGCDIVVSNRLAHASSTDVYTLTSDADVVEGKTYYTKSGSTYSAVDTPVKANISTYYEKETLPTAQAFIVKPEALALVNKRGVMVEFDRDPQTQKDYVYGSKLYAPYLYDASKIIKIAL